MKRVGGQVTWLCEFDGERSDLAAKGIKRQTLRRCHIVMAGDTLRLSTGGDNGVFAEVVVRRVRPITIRAMKTLDGWRVLAMIGGVEVSREEFSKMAVEDGFEYGAELVNWLYDHGKVVDGEFDGQIIEW